MEKKMKRVVFAWVSEWVDFTSYEEAIKYVKDNRAKGWRFIVPDVTTYSGYSAEANAEKIVYENGDSEYKYTVQYEKPYRNYNMG